MTEKIGIFSSHCLLRKITEVKERSVFSVLKKSYPNVTFCLEKARYFGYLKKSLSVMSVPYGPYPYNSVFLWLFTETWMWSATFYRGRTRGKGKNRVCKQVRLSSVDTSEWMPSFEVPIFKSFTHCRYSKLKTRALQDPAVLPLWMPSVGKAGWFSLSFFPKAFGIQKQVISLLAPRESRVLYSDFA